MPQVLGNPGQFLSAEQVRENGLYVSSRLVRVFQLLVAMSVCPATRWQHSVGVHRKLHGGSRHPALPLRVTTHAER